MLDLKNRSAWIVRLFLVLVVLALTVSWSGMVDLQVLPDSVVRADEDDDDAGDEIEYEDDEDRSGADNIVEVENRKDGRLRVRGRVQLNRITGSTVDPINSAYAYSSCTGCQTLAVALQVNLIGRDAKQVVPQNAAVAVNVECSRCVTVAVALQYIYSVDDPREVPKDVDRAIKRMNRELKDVAKDKDATLAEAIDRINAVIVDFEALATSFDDDRDAETASTSPNATPAAATAASPEASPEATLADETITPTAGSDEPTETEPPSTDESSSEEVTVEPHPTEPAPAATTTPTPEPTAAPEEEASPPA